MNNSTILVGPLCRAATLTSFTNRKVTGASAGDVKDCRLFRGRAAAASRILSCSMSITKATAALKIHSKNDAYRGKSWLTSRVSLNAAHDLHGNCSASTSPRTGSLNKFEGFFVRKKRHSVDCACRVCINLRGMMEPVNPSSISVPVTSGNVSFSKSPIFASNDGGFVVGKQQQKHHVAGCRCPNCNYMRFMLDTNGAKCITLTPEVLVELVGEDMCNQIVLNDEVEKKRRAKISAANKGNVAWNKGRRHPPETVAKIRASTSKAMQSPKVRQKMREAAVKQFHSETTKMKIRRTVRDNAHRKVGIRVETNSIRKGRRPGKVGVCTIGTFARRVSAVQRLSFGIWTRSGLDGLEAKTQAQLRKSKKIAKERNRLLLEKVRQVSINADGSTGKKMNKSRGVPKTEEHKAAISAALRAKWEDPVYIASQKRSSRERKLLRVKSTKSSVSRSCRYASSVTDIERRRGKLVLEMKEIYSKATSAVKALENQKLAGLNVDESMLKKALTAVSETRSALDSAGVLEITESTIANEEDDFNRICIARTENRNKK